MGRIAGIFPVGDGEQFVVAEWHPDPELIEAQLIKMADAFGDWTEPLMEARAAMIYDTELHFRKEQDPYGKKWQSLNPDYADSKTKTESNFPDSILMLSGKLKERATSGMAWFIDESSIYFRPWYLPDYGALHQSGTQNEGRAAIMESAISQIQSGGINSLSGEQLKTFVEGGRGHNLPQRMFIGADAETIEVIEDIFVRHLDKTVTKHWDDPIVGGPTQLLGSNIRGTFPIIGFTKYGQPRLSTGQFGRKF